MKQSILLVLFALCAAAPACDHVVPGCGSIDGHMGTCGIGEMCASSLDCESSNCDSGLCQASCTRAEDCASDQICVSVVDGPGSRRYCSSVCPPGDWHVVGDTNGLVCIAGVLRHCTDLADVGPACDVCRCPTGSQCLDPAGVDCRLAETPCMCLAPQPVGRPCISNVGCISFNCSGTGDDSSRHCEEPAGTLCDMPIDCVHCDAPNAGGMTTCRQSCERDADCGTGICIPLSPTEPACYIDCTLDDHCPTGVTCTPLAGDPRSRRYCPPS